MFPGTKKLGRFEQFLAPFLTSCATVAAQNRGTAPEFSVNPLIFNFWATEIAHIHGPGEGRVLDPRTSQNRVFHTNHSE